MATLMELSLDGTAEATLLLEDVAAANATRARGGKTVTPSRRDGRAEAARQAALPILAAVGPAPRPSMAQARPAERCARCRGAMLHDGGFASCAGCGWTREAAS